jgi:hypothetical protein
MKLLAWVQYTDKVLGGDSKFFRIRINPKYEGDLGLLAHEHEHVRQWYMVTNISFFLMCTACLIFYPIVLTHPLTVLMLLFYSSMVYNAATMMSKKIRFKVEVACYAKQIKMYPEEHTERYLKHFSKFIAENYELNVSQEDARNALVEALY